MDKAFELSWKPDWPEARRHYVDWWNREGLVLSAWGCPPRSTPRVPLTQPPAAEPPSRFFTDPAYRAACNHWRLAMGNFPGDTLPIADTMIGPGSLALTLGSQPGFSPETVWYEPTMMDDEAPEQRPPFAFDPDNRWLLIHEETCRRCADLGRDKYLVGIPDLVENVDILSALRDPQHLMVDMVERPAWIEEKMWEINEVWFQVYDRLYERVKLADGSSAFACFGIWGPGKIAKVQCDAAAMFSPAMFQRFVAPALTAQCEWLDHSLFHLDGTQCICHLDHLLAIEALDAIEWTPQAGIENGGSSRWYELYRRTLDAGKSVQIIGVRPEEVQPLLDTFGGKGLYIAVGVSSIAEYEALYELADAYR